MKTNTKVINEKNRLSRTKRGKKERLRKIRKGNIILDKDDRKNKRRAYHNNESVFNPDNINSMRVATVRARKVIPHHRQQGLSDAKLNQIRLILIADTINDNILYLNLTNYKPFHDNRRKYLTIDPILDNNKRQSIDLYLGDIDYSNANIRRMRINGVRIHFNIKLSNKSKQAIYRAVNGIRSNIQKSINFKN